MPSMMDRRTMITLLSACSLTGCIEQIRSVSGSGDTPTQSPPTGEPQSVTAGPLKIATIPRQAPTKQEPGIINCRLVNTADEEKQIWFGHTPPISNYISKPRNGTQLMLAPRTGEYSIGDMNDDGELQVPPETRSGRCWQTADVAITLQSSVDRTLSPNESITREYSVMGHQGCLTDGNYIIEEEYSIGPDPDRELTVEIPVTPPT